jgi:hypothetical protein
MIQIRGTDIYRAGQKIGYVEGNHIFSHEGKKLGFVEGNHIYNSNNQKLGYLEGDKIYDSTGKQHISIEANQQLIQGGEYSDTQRAAIRFLLGE